MGKSVKKMGWLILLLLFGIPCSAWSGGLYLYEVGTPEVGLAAAGWAARAQDAATVFTNPAGMTRLDHSELMVGIQPFYLNEEFKPGRNTTTSGNNGEPSTWFPSGGTYYVHSLTPDLKLGMSIAGYFGLGLEYDNDWVGRYYVREVGVQAMGLQPTMAYRVNDKLSVGMGISVVYGTLSEKIAVNNIDPGIGDGAIKVEDEDITYQINTGIMYEPKAGTRFGLQYMSQADLEFSDVPEFSALGPGLSTILGNRGLLNANLDLDMTMPQSVIVSAFHEINEKVAVMANIGWQQWSEFGMVGVTVQSEDTTSLTVDRNYDDTWHAAVGLQYRLSNPWLLSAGIAYDTGMVDEEYLTPDLPLGDQWRYGFGA